jgi:AcrR family transcriptional regulator
MSWLPIHRNAIRLANHPDQVERGNVENEKKTRTRPSSLDTRIAIIEAAERLFADQGVEAVSMRTISEEAGQRNSSSVQYHFDDRMGLLRAIFEYREGQLDAARALLLTAAREHGHLSDVRWLLRVMFYPEFRHHVDCDGLPFIKLHAQYLANLRPRGILHPVDYECPSTVAYRETIALLRQKLNFLTDSQFMMRLESVGAMFLGALMQQSLRLEQGNEHAATLFATLLEMMAAAITVPPWDFSFLDE